MVTSIGGPVSLPMSVADRCHAGLWDKRSVVGGLIPFNGRLRPLPGGAGRSPRIHQGKLCWDICALVDAGNCCLISLPHSVTMPPHDTVACDLIGHVYHGRRSLMRAFAAGNDRLPRESRASVDPRLWHASSVHYLLTQPGTDFMRNDGVAQAGAGAASWWFRWWRRCANARSM